jgi:hypothetical protein
MADTTLPQDFKEFLRLLNANDVEYLVVGRYAVGYYGYPRYTADIDIWIGLNEATATRLEVISKPRFRDAFPELFGA